MKIYIYTALLVAYALGVAVALLFMAALGIGVDVHINDHYFVIPIVTTGFFLLVLLLPLWALVLLIRREMRRKRLVETSQ